ncbi:MAG: 2,3-bisphosphoglycerate-independent phosphoglycerate mutase [bacterium]|nr:2,3-bisphosphoglycerate-independent phosphoglycerate mutase [bacterium]
MDFKPVVLIVLDGFGINALPGESPMQVAQKPHLDEIASFYPITALQASGLAIGLPWGEEGNSETGHLTIGSGRVVYHHLPRIIVSIQDGTFFENQALLEAANQVKGSNGTLHLAGLISSGSVHAYIDHLYALLDFAHQQDIKKVAIHVYGDGRDSPTNELKTFLPQVEERLKAQYPEAYIASLLGRHFTMDREGSWELTEQAYNCFIGKSGESFENPRRYIDESYQKGVTDEFLVPAWKVNETGEPQGRVKEGDAFVLFNFREDSERQMAHSFCDDTFDTFARGPKIPNLFMVTMTEYEEGMNAHAAFPPLNVEWPLSRVISYAGRKQFHVAETEKYAHVTYFFNGGKEQPFPAEERKLIPSKKVKFDENPEMSAAGITDAVLGALPNYDFILINFANADMVGHTGNFKATVKAIETLDVCTGRIKEKVLEMGGAMVITADHGNSEEKRYRLTGEPRTKHSSNPVPFFLVANQFKRKEARTPEDVKERLSQVEGVLADVAPTVLDLMGLAVPAEMTGINLLPRLLV